MILLQDAIKSFKTRLNENSVSFLKEDEKKKINFIDLDGNFTLVKIKVRITKVYKSTHCFKGLVFDVNNFKRVKEVVY